MQKKLKQLYIYVLIFTVLVNMMSITDISMTAKAAERGYVEKQSEGYFRVHGSKKKQAVWKDRDEGGAVYCIEPDVHRSRTGKKIVKSLNGYRGLSKKDVSLISIGLKYIDDMYSGFSFTNKRLLKQIYIWESFYKATGDKSGNFSIPKAVSEKEFKNIFLKARQYANKNIEKYIAEGYLYKDKNGYQSQAAFTLKEAEGSLKLKKQTKTNRHIIESCKGSYSLKGAVYGVYRNKKLIAKLVTDEHGNSKAIKISVGSYIIREITAPKGYSLDKTSHKIRIESNKLTVFRAEDEPKLDPIKILLKKKPLKAQMYDGDKKKNENMSGAIFEVRYFDTLSSIEGKKIKRYWKFRTDSRGEVHMKSWYKIGGDSFFKDSKGRIVAPVGTYIIIEKKAPIGFKKLSDPVFLKVYGQDNPKVSLKNKAAVDFPEPTKVIYLNVLKIDKQTGKYYPQGVGNFSGAVYGVYSKDKQGKYTKLLKKIKITKKNGYYSGYVRLLKGSYELREITAPKGYLLDKKSYRFTVTYDDYTGKINDYLSKRTSKDKMTLEYFIKSKEEVTTFEFEKFSIDEEGIEYPVSGAEIELIDNKGKVVMKWKSRKDIAKKVIKGLEKGKYTLREKKAPAGYDKAADISFVLDEKNPKKFIRMYDKENLNPKILSTTATFDDSSKENIAEKANKIIDKISYKDLEVGKKYKLIGKLMDKQTGKPLMIDGTEVTAEKEFTAETRKGTAEMEFAIDMTKVKGKDIV